MFLLCTTVKVIHSIGIDVRRMHKFENTTHNNLRLLPPSRLGLSQHIKRAAYHAGWVNRQCVENGILPDPTEWGWKFTSGAY